MWPSSDTLGFNSRRERKKNWILFRNKFSGSFQSAADEGSPFFFLLVVGYFSIKNHCSCSRLARCAHRKKNCRSLRWIVFFCEMMEISRTRRAVDRERGVEGLKMVRSLVFLLILVLAPQQSSFLVTTPRLVLDMQKKNPPLLLYIRLRQLGETVESCWENGRTDWLGQFREKAFKEEEEEET